MRLGLLESAFSVVFHASRNTGRRKINKLVITKRETVVVESSDEIRVIFFFDLMAAD